MRNKKLPVILTSIMVAWILASVVFMYVDNNFSITYLFQGIGLGVLTDGVILFGMANFYGLKNSLASKSRSDLKYTAKRNTASLFKILIIFIIIGTFTSCILLKVNHGDFTAANIGFLTLVVTAVLFMFTGLLSAIKGVVGLKKEYGIVITILIVIIVVLIIFIRYQK